MEINEHWKKLMAKLVNQNCHLELEYAVHWPLCMDFYASWRHFCPVLLVKAWFCVDSCTKYGLCGFH